MDQTGATNPTIIRLKGRATIHKIGVVQESLKQALERNRPIRIDVEGVTEVDLSFIQLLISTAYSCSQSKVDIAVIKAGKQHPLSLYVEKMGFKNLRFLESEAS